LKRRSCGAPAAGGRRGGPIGVRRGGGVGIVGDAVTGFGDIVFLFAYYSSARVKFPCEEFTLSLSLARFALQNSMPARLPRDVLVVSKQKI
ncbi:MAG: hypothetical protein QG607_146, partial [Patescibacteria group bacterium]|nr:hypothetical protein [Patescibacteria group bacterium]